MFIHIVCWRFRELGENGRSKAENALEVRRRFEALRGVIPGMTRCEVGINVDPSPDASDAVLFSEFESAEAFAAYPPHPAHQEIVAFLKGVRTERRVIDYELVDRPEQYLRVSGSLDPGNACG
jgi:hypothetical protein